jgi:hypothetical protein
MSYYKQQVEAIRFHETTAAKLRDELYSDIEVLFEEGLASRPGDEDPVKAAGRYITKLLPETLISAADMKDQVPAVRDLTHRAITALLSQHPALVDGGAKDRHGLKLFRRIDELLPIAAE